MHVFELAVAIYIKFFFQGFELIPASQYYNECSDMTIAVAWNAKPQLKQTNITKL